MGFRISGLGFKVVDLDVGFYHIENGKPSLTITHKSSKSCISLVDMWIHLAYAGH